jgi:DNA-directed RNA polymerase subunit beta
MPLIPVLAESNDKREHIRKRVIEGVQSVFPMKVKDYTVEVQNATVHAEDYSSREQKDAILRGKTLQEALKADVLLKDADGKIIEEKKNVTIAQIPYFTPRHTFIVDGNEYVIANQRRVRPGVYTRVRGNEELEATFNLSKGSNFRLNMDPAKGHLYMEYGTSKIPLYATLKGLGVTDTEMKAHWGAGVVDLNKDAFAKKQDSSIKKLYEKLIPSYRQTVTTSEGMARAISEEYETNTSMDADVNQRTLGYGYKKVTPQALLVASQKLLDVHRAGVTTDDRDSLGFQTLHGVEDFLKERVGLEARNLRRKMTIKASGGQKPSLDRILPASPFTRSLRGFITTANLSAIPTQINPVEILDTASRITSLGEGGISSERAIPGEARNLHSTHFGVIDPARTPESGKAGVDLRAALWTQRDENGRVYTKLRNVRTGRVEDVPVDKLEVSTIAFPGEMRRSTGIGVLQKGFVTSVKKSDVDYEMTHASSMYGPTTNLVPMPESLQGNRIVMGSKMQTQALPLLTREAPLVQVGSFNRGRTMEDEIADLIVPVAPVSGIIRKVDKDYIYIEPEKTKHSEVQPIYLREASYVMMDKTAAGTTPLIKVHYDDNFPLASKTYLHNNVQVKAGDRVTKGQQLADSNFTMDGKLALGKNLVVGYMAYKGLNSNDAVVISESASVKLTSEHMYKEMMLIDSDMVLDVRKYRAQFPSTWTAAQLANLDEQGVAKSGVTVNPGDPIIIALRKATPTAEMQMLGRLHKTLAHPYREEVITWIHRSPGTVFDVINTGSRVVVTIKTQETAGVGDKISGRYGNKGVIAKVIPDDQMIRTKDDKPLDILMTSAGIISRVNPAQIIETAVSKVALKTGKPVIIDSLSGQNNVQWAKDLLKKHGISDKEIVHDPTENKDIVGPDGKGIMVGPQYILKLFKSTETNYAAHGVEDYDVNQQPAKGGGEESAKGLGRLEIQTLMAHNARNVLQEAATLKGTRNDEFWRAYQLGQPLPKLKSSFAYDKFRGMLQGAGIQVDKSGNNLLLRPLTDNDIKKMSAGAIKSPTMVRERDLKPEKNGLFDPVITGGANGDRWSHVDLREPILNPTFEEPVRRLLGLTQADLRKQLSDEGGSGIRRRLDKLDLGKKERELKETVRNATGASLDDAVKQMKYLQALKKENLTPAEAYILSKLPVIPPVMRPVLPSTGKRDLLVSDANYLYRDAMLANEVLGEMKNTKLPEEIGRARLGMYDATKAVFGLADPVSPQLQGRKAKGFITTISGKGSPKGGFFHGKLLRMPQDLSGRGTAVPDLTLGMDQVGLPEDMVWSTFGPHIIRRMVQNGYKALDAKQMIEDKHPVARDAMMAETKIRPVLVNRAPTLHRHGIVGAYVVPVPGKTIRVNPFIEEGMNLDYDGDALQIHVPVQDKAVNEIKGMTMSNMLFGDKTRNNLLVFPQHEAILGIYAASSAAGGKRYKFKTKQEAMAAYNKGDVDIADTAHIG